MASGEELKRAGQGIAWRNEAKGGCVNWAILSKGRMSMLSQNVDPRLFNNLVDDICRS